MSVLFRQLVGVFVFLLSISGVKELETKLKIHAPAMRRQFKVKVSKENRLPRDSIRDLFISLIWRSLNLWKGHLTIPKRWHIIDRLKAFISRVYFILNFQTTNKKLDFQMLTSQTSPNKKLTSFLKKVYCFFCNHPLTLEVKDHQNNGPLQLLIVSPYQKKCREKPLKTIVDFDFQRLRFYSPNVLAIGSSGKKVWGGHPVRWRRPFEKCPGIRRWWLVTFAVAVFLLFGPSKKNMSRKFARKICFFLNRRSALGFSLFYFYWWYSIRDTCIKLQQASQHAARRIATAITSTVRLVLPPDFEISWNDVLGVKERYTRTHRINVW